jgi:hypothetical protein
VRRAKATAAKTATATKAAAKRTSTRASKAVKAAADGAIEVGSSRKKVAIGVAAIAGVAAGVAAIVGRKKLVQASSEALEAVTGSSSESGPTRSAD